MNRRRVAPSVTDKTHTDPPAIGSSASGSSGKRIAGPALAAKRIAAKGHAADYPAGFRIAPHRHRSHQIVHAAAGVMRVRCAQGLWLVPPGQALWMPAGLEHSIDCLGAVAMRTVYLGGEHPAFPDRCTVWRLSPFLRELIVRLASPADAASVPPLLQLVLAEIATLEPLPLSAPAPADARLRRATDALLADDGIDLPVAVLARAAGMSTRSLLRHFRSDTGMTLRQWRLQVRLMRALERLGSGASVSAAAYDAGYGSASAFVHAFRAVFGSTPRRYMRQAPLSRARSARP